MDDIIFEAQYYMLEKMVNIVFSHYKITYIFCDVYFVIFQNWEVFAKVYMNDIFFYKNEKLEMDRDTKY